MDSLTLLFATRLGHGMSRMAGVERFTEAVRGHERQYKGNAWKFNTCTRDRIAAGWGRPTLPSRWTKRLWVR